jgi:hypothetical protein
MSIKVKGADEAVRVLQTMDSIFAKEIKREISSAGRLVADYAKQKAPTQPTMSGWRETPAARGRTRGGAGWPAWQNPGVSVSRRGASVVIASTGAVAAIYESAGKNGLNGLSQNGGQFIRNNSRYGRLVKAGERTGRLMIPAIQQTYPEVIKRIREACDRAVDEANRRLNPWQ